MKPIQINPLQLMSFTIIRTLISLWLAHFLVDFMIGVWAIYKTMAHLDLFAAGVISGVGAFLGEGMQIFFGPWSDKGWRKHLICGGLLVTAASGFLAYSTDYWYLFLLFSVTCLGSGAFHPAAISLAGSLTSNRKAMMIAIFASGGGLGLACSQIVFSHFHHLLDGNTAILIVPYVLLTIALVFYGLTNLKNFNPAEPAHDISVKALFRLFKRPNLRLLYIAQVSNGTLFWGAIFLLPDVLLCKGYGTWMCHGGAHLFLILGGAIMVIPFGYLADRYSPKAVLLVAFFISLITFYAFLFTPVLANGLLIPLVFVMGASLATINPVIIALGNRLAPESPGMVSAFLMGLAWCISEGLGQSGGGFLTRFFEEHAPVYAMGLLGLFYLSGITASLLLPSSISVQSKQVA